MIGRMQVRAEIDRCAAARARAREVDILPEVSVDRNLRDLPRGTELRDVADLVTLNQFSTRTNGVVDVPELHEAAPTGVHAGAWLHAAFEQCAVAVHLSVDIQKRAKTREEIIG